jgi:hypothetical protein
MMISSSRLVVGASLIAALAVPARAQEPLPKPVPQNPSPMVEHTRLHERLEERDLPGVRVTVDGLLAKPVNVFIPRKAATSRPFRLLIHFLGAAFVPEHAVSHVRSEYLLAVVNLGPGSAVYENAFKDPAVFDRLLDAVRERLKSHSGGAEFSGVVLSAFSAGHGAIRSILREPRHAAAVDGVLLLDGLHAGYLPPRTVLAEGGAIDESPLTPFLRFAESAIGGKKVLVITHSEIFPGTFASTTETTDYLIRALGLKRLPVLAWGPLGMQQLSKVEQGRLAILGFAGNSAPDHVDHFHAMHHFLALLDDPLANPRGKEPAPSLRQSSGGARLPSR